MTPILFLLLKKYFYCLFITAIFIFFWWLIVHLWQMPAYILPDPLMVFEALWTGRFYLGFHTLITLTEIILAFILGIIFGAIVALLLILFPKFASIAVPILVTSQAIPVFALGPILVLWFGFGMISKIIAAIFMIFFPVAISFYEGLKKTKKGWLELAQLMGASSLSQLFQVRFIAALPALGSGIRIAAAIAPIGAIIGEWVGSSGGLGYVMLNANARMQTAVCFAALFILACLTLLLWKIVDLLLKQMIFWITEQENKGSS